MKILRIYVDTSVIGGCFDAEFELWSLGLFKDFVQGKFKPLLSQVTTAELQDAPEQVQVLYAELLELQPEIIPVNETALELADVYQRRKILTPNFFNDGLHIALATISEADVLVSWNFKHIVHLDKIRLFNAVNLEYGYKPLQIYSPREVTTNGTEED